MSGAFRNLIAHRIGLASSQELEAIARLQASWTQLEAINPETSYSLLSAMAAQLPSHKQLPSRLNTPDPIQPQSGRSSGSNMSGETLYDPPTPALGPTSVALVKQPPMEIVRRKRGGTNSPGRDRPEQKSLYKERSSEFNLKPTDRERAIQVSRASGVHPKTRLRAGTSESWTSTDDDDDRRVELEGALYRSREKTQTDMLADVLYGRWLEGLRSRWETAR